MHFPALASVRIGHPWCGFAACALDEMMHLAPSIGDERWRNRMPW